MMYIPYIKHAWNPSRLIDSGNMVLWLDASDSDTITDVAGAVSEWRDKSGNGNNAIQATADDKPTTGSGTLNGLNALTLDDDFLDLTTQITTLKSAFFVANKLNGSVANTSISPIFGEDNSSGSGDYVFINVNESDINFDISIDGTTGNTGNANVNGESLVSGTNIDLGQTNAENESSNIWYCDFDVSATVNFICKTDISAGVFVNKGDICEIILLSNVPSTTDRQKIEGYLAHKWVNKLPTNHPYKVNKPIV